MPVIHLLYFGAYRERRGLDQEHLELPEGATAGAALAACFPDRRALPPARLALNRAMVGPDAALSDGDELAILPPVGGG
jgi:molybdopterin converting factor small subunit